MVYIKNSDSLGNRYIKLLSVLLLVCSSFQVFSQNYHIVNYFQEEELPQPYVYTINQDNSGYLWIGTGNGLTRFDGYEFRTFTTEDSLADNFITCSFKNDKRIWFGHMNGDLSYYFNGNFKKIGIPSKDKTKITDIEKGLNNEIIASTYSNGILFLNSSKIAASTQSNTEVLPSIISFKPLSKNELLVGSNNGLLVYKYNRTAELTFKEQIVEIPNGKISDIIELPGTNGFLIATENKGIFKLIIENKGYKVSKLDFRNILGIEKLHIDIDNNLWIASMSEGLYKLTENENDDYTTLTLFDSSMGFPSKYTKTIFEDREGIIWSGNYGTGLSKIIKRKYAYAFYNEDLIGEKINALCIDNKFIWLGTDLGLLKINKKSSKSEKQYKIGKGLSTNIVTSLASTEKYIWLGTKKNGIFTFNKNTQQTKPFPISTGNLENSITTITTHKNEIWIGTRKGVCRIDPVSNKIKWYSISKGGLPNNNINYIYADNDGKIWIATACNTLSVIENNSIKKIAIPIIDKPFIIKSVTEDKNGFIWVSTLGNGIYKFDGDKLIHFTTSNGLFSDYCYSIYSDKKENLWVGHIGGISQINTTTSHVKSIQKNFEILKEYEFRTHAAVCGIDSSMYLGFNKGILRINFYDKVASPAAPLLIIKSLKLNDKEIDVKTKIKLTSGSYKLAIDFVGINFKEPLLTKYQYMLDGFDAEPIITTEKRAVYPRLSSGIYTFHLEAINGDGIVSTNNIDIILSINPPLWKRPSFYVFLIIIFFLILIFWINRQKRIIKRENRILEEKVKIRTSEILNQKDKIEKQSQIISEKNDDITDSIIYASKIQQAIMPPIDSINSYLPNVFVLNKPLNIVSGDFYWVTEKDNKIIFAVADSTGHGVPGAFMSILGITLLNHIVIYENTMNPSLILTKMRNGIINLLNQKEKDITSDSINMGICCFNKEKMEMEYSGAYHDLVHIRDNTLNIISPNYQTLGITRDKPVKFINHKFNVKTGDCLYMYSDGLQDQFGGNRDRKFSKKRLHDLLIQVAIKTPDEQKEIIFNSFKQWKGSTDQIDDILIMGVKI